MGEINDTSSLYHMIEKIEHALDMRRPELAIQWIMLQLQKDPQASELYILLARAYDQQGKRLPAVRAMQQALALDPQNAYAFAYYGILISSGLSMKEAEQSFQTALSLDPESFYAHYWYAYFLYHVVEDFQKALFHIQKALELTSDRADCHALKGLILARLGRLDEAERAIELSVSLDPESYDTHYAKGIFYTQYKRDLDRALPSLTEAVRLNPDNETLRDYYISAVGAKKKVVGIFWSVGFWLKRMRKNSYWIFAITIAFFFLIGFLFQSRPTIGLFITVSILIIYLISFLFAAIIDPLFRKAFERNQYKQRRGGGV